MENCVQNSLSDTGLDLRSVEFFQIYTQMCQVSCVCLFIRSVYHHAYKSDCTFQCHRPFLTLFSLNSLPVLVHKRSAMLSAWMMLIASRFHRCSENSLRCSGASDILVGRILIYRTVIACDWLVVRSISCKTE